MNKRLFIKLHRTEIDRAINLNIYRHDGNGGPGTIPDPPPRYSDADREQWLANDEGLYSWAQSAGINL